MMKRKFEFSATYAGEEAPFARIWWTGRKVDCDDPSLLKQLSGINLNNTRIKDGLKFFWNIPLMFLNGRIALKRTK